MNSDAKYLLDPCQYLSGSKIVIVCISFGISFWVLYQTGSLCTLIVADNTILATVYLSTVACTSLFQTIWRDYWLLLYSKPFCYHLNHMCVIVCDCVRLRLNTNCFFIVDSNLFLSLSLLLLCFVLFFSLVEYGLEFDLHSVFDKSSINNQQSQKYSMKIHNKYITHTEQKANIEKDFQQQFDRRWVIKSAKRRGKTHKPKRPVDKYSFFYAFPVETCLEKIILNERKTWTNNMHAIILNVRRCATNWSWAMYFKHCIL